MVQIPFPLDFDEYRECEPLDMVKHAVTVGWLLMYPEDESEGDCDKAYAVSYGGYIAGHPEAASNIGVLIIREKLSDKLTPIALGPHDKFEMAEAWFRRAIEGKHHSPQAEVEMAKIIAAKPYDADTEALIDMYLNLAIQNASNPDSLWADEKDKWLSIIAKVRKSIDDYFALSDEVYGTLQ